MRKLFKYLVLLFASSMLFTACNKDNGKEVKDNNPPIVSLTSPENKFVTENGAVKFSWKGEDPDKDEIVYDLYIGTKEGNEYTWIHNVKDIKTNTYSLDKPLDYGTYYWKVIVREVKTKGLLKAESQIYSFTLNEPKADLKLSNNTLELTVGEVGKVQVVSGNGDYTAVSNDEQIVKAEIANGEITVTAIAAGTAKVIVTDTKADQTQEISVMVKEPLKDLLLSTNEVELGIGDMGTIEIISGNGEYSITSDNEQVVTAEITNSIVTIIAVSAGTAKLIVTDTKTEQTQEIAVTVKGEDSADVPEGVVIKDGVLVEWPCDKIPDDGHVIIPNSVTTIGAKAFSKCANLISISIPTSVTTIESKAFSYCLGLISITIPNSVKTIGDGAFSYCYNLTSINLSNTLVSIGEHAFSFSSLASVKIPNSVTTIGNFAFYICEKLTSVTLSNSLTSIGEGTFNGCGSLSEITIPNSVTSIGDEAFRACSSIPVMDIPESVTSIGDGAFADCYSISSVTIPNSVKTIGEFGFYQCTSLTSVVIPNSVTSIGARTFARCSKLNSITIPTSVTSIGASTFYKCTSLSSITLPNSLTSIGKDVFEGCTSLALVVSKATTPPVGDKSLGYLDKLMVPKGSKPAYEKDDVWGRCRPIVEEE